MSEEKKEEEAPTELSREELEADVAKSAERVMKHMNDDHEDSLVAYALALATHVEGTEAEKDEGDAWLKNIQTGVLTITSAQMTAVDADGFVLELEARGSTDLEVITLKNVRVPYSEPISSAKDLHHTAVDMHRKAYDQLGVWYKTKTGYYNKVAKMAASQAYKEVQKSEYYQSIRELASDTEKTTVMAGAAAVVSGFAAAAYLRGRGRAA